MTKWTKADLTNPRAPIDRKAMHELLDALLDIREKSDPDGDDVDPARLEVPYVPALHGSRENFEHARNNGPIKAGKDAMAVWALHCTGLLFNAVGGWAVSHCVGRWKRSRQTGMGADSHEWEEIGTALAQNSPDTDNSKTVRRSAEIYMYEVGGRVLPSWLSQELNEAFQALNFGVTPPIFDVDGSGKKRIEYKRHLRDHLLLQAIQYVKYREAQGFKKGKVIEEVATAFGRSPDGVKGWERKELPKRFGNDAFAEVIGRGIAAGRLKSSIERDPSTQFDDLSEDAWTMWELDDLDLTELGEDFRRINAEIKNGAAADED